MLRSTALPRRELQRQIGCGDGQHRGYGECDEWRLLGALTRGCVPAAPCGLSVQLAGLVPWQGQII
jgi:hypothetical protein